MQRERPGLVPLKLVPLPLGQLTPEGWLKRQLSIQADGLSGHLDEFWPDVAESGWIGGAAEGWERGPYWLDGLVPLAYLLRDDHLIARVQCWIDAILVRQGADGWLGPRQNAATGRYKLLDPWPVSVFVKAALQYHSATHDERIVPAPLAFYHRLASQLEATPQFDWGRMRWPEIVLGMQALYDLTGEGSLLALGETAHRHGYDWAALFADYPYTGRTERADISMPSHVVNNAMAIKGGGLRYRQSGNPADLGASWRMLDLLEAYHGQVSGVFSGDEHVAGRNPSQGTELCAVVEMMYSLEVMLSVAGDPDMGDALERIAFNALPATFKPDMWAHQYDQQANQPVCQVVPDPIYTNNAPESNIYGLEPNYGCCTANMHQGWPKYAAHLWMRVPADRETGEGLAALSLAPCYIDSVLSGVPVNLRVETTYPFEEQVRITVHADTPVVFPLLLRVPRWAKGARLRIDGTETLAPAPGEFARLLRTWQGTTRLILDLPMDVRTETRYHGAASVLYGPLVLALEIGEDWRQIGGTPPHADWEVHPTTPWNYALRLDRAAPEESIHVARRLMGDYPFSPAGVPIYATAQGTVVPEWGLERGTAGPIPRSPVACQSPLVDLRMIPFGATNLRIAEFPTTGDHDRSGSIGEHEMP
jgi:hypothetical protein